MNDMTLAVSNELNSYCSKFEAEHGKFADGVSYDAMPWEKRKWRTFAKTIEFNLADGPAPADIKSAIDEIATAMEGLVTGGASLAKPEVTLASVDSGRVAITITGTALLPEGHPNYVKPFIEIGEFAKHHGIINLTAKDRHEVDRINLIELLRASPSPAHWHLADKLEQAAA